MTAALPDLAPPASRLRFTPGRFATQWLAVLVLVPVLWVVTVRPPYRNAPPIRSDGAGYHAWTRAILSRDFTFCKDPVLEEVAAITERVKGHCVNKYPPGLALLRLPVMGWFAIGEPRVTHAENRANQYLGAIALLAVAAFATASLMQLGRNGVAAQLGILAVTFGTGLFHYATYDASFTHVYSAALASALLWVVLRAAAAKRAPSAIAVGAIALVAVAVRSTNVVMSFAIVASVAAWTAWRAAEAPAERSRYVARWVVPVVAGWAAATLLQASYLFYATGRLTLSGYGDETFLLGRPMQRSVLLSYERGLFTYYPVMAVVLVVGLVVRRTRLAAAGLALLVLVYTVVYGFWESWFLGAGFGHRGFVDMAPLAMVVLGVALAELRAVRRTAALGAAALCTMATVSLMAGYWRGTVPYGGTTTSVYWDHVVGDENLLRVASD